MTPLLPPLLLALAVAAGDGHDEALAAARREGAAGRWQSAARLLEAPATIWPQDYPVQLERAWCLFQAGDLDGAAEAYERARSLAPEAVEPELGLGWTALRAEDAARARRHLSEVLRRSPGSASAEEGLALLGPENRLALALVGAYASSRAEARPALGSGALALDGLLLDRLALGGLYRLLGAQSASAGSRGRGAGVSLQHELHGSVGWSSGRWGVAAHGGWIGASALADAGALAGGSAWLRATSWLELDGALLRTFSSGGDATQWQAGAGLRLSPRLVLRAGARGQATAGGDGLAALASLELRGRLGGWLAAELGTQRRPVDLAARAIYATPAPLRWATRAGLTFPLGGSLAGLAAVDLESWGPTAPGAGDDGLGWRGSAGVRLAF